MSLPATTAAPARLLLACLLALTLGACQTDDAASRSSQSGPATTAAGDTTDPGSRYLDAAGPLGGLTAETPPVSDDFVAPPVRAPAPARPATALPEPVRYATPPRPPPPYK